MKSSTKIQSKKLASQVAKRITLETNMTPTARGGPYGKIISGLLQKYPVRNAVWHYYEEDNSFAAEISTLEGNGMLDPWNRPVPPQNSWEPVYHGSDEDREIGKWTLVVTVSGVHVELTIFND